MSFGLFGAEFAFFELFERHLRALSEAVQELHQLLAQFTDMRTRCARIRELERQSSSTAREITRELALTQIRPLERHDIHLLNLAMTEAIGAVQAVATRIGLYGFDQIRPVAIDLSTSLLEMVDLVEGMLRQFRTKASVNELRERMATVKAEADAFVLVALGEAYEVPLDRPADALEVIKWAQVFDRFEEALDRVGRIADVIDGILLKRV